MSRNVLRGIRAKLNNRRGETLAEVLVAILISSLGMIMLANAIGSASNIVKQGRAATDDQYVNEGELANLTGAKTVTVTVTRELPDGSTPVSEPVSVNSTTKSIGGKDVTAYEVAP